jgi:hypothetical protein
LKQTCIALLLVFALSTARHGHADESSKGSLWSAIDWRLRLGLSDFQVEDSDTFGVMAGFKGEYLADNGIKLRMLFTATLDYDQDELDSDHIPIWFKSYLKAEKTFWQPSGNTGVLGTLDFEHKMNTVSSIEQSADLMPGFKLDFESRLIELFAKFGAGLYYLEIDDDLPREYSDYPREDLTHGALAWFQEYKAEIGLDEHLSLSGKYKKFRSFDSESLETREEIELDYHFTPATEFVLKAEKTHYNLDQFERSAGDNGLAVLPFDKDVHYLAYIEYDY